MNSRALLAAGLLLVAALAGCSAVLDDDTESASPPELNGVSLVNEHAEPHSLDVVVTENGSVVYWTRVELEAATVESDGTRAATTERLEPPALGDRGEYAVAFRLDDAASGRRLDASEYLSESCPYWYVEVEDDGTLDYGVSCR